jgi:hypothetical protein
MARISKADRKQFDPQMPMCELQCQVYQWTAEPFEMVQKTLRVPTLVSPPEPLCDEAKKILDVGMMYLFGQTNQQTGNSDYMLEDALKHAGFSVETPLPVGFWIIEFKGQKLLTDMWAGHPIFEWKFEWVRIFTANFQRAVQIKAEDISKLR